MKSKIENCLYMQVAHCNKCGGQSGYNIIDGEKVCFDCGEPYEADFSVSKVETTITTTNSQDQEEENTVCEGAVFTDMELIAIEIAVQRSLKFEKGFGTKNEMIPNGYEEILRKLSKLTTK